MTLSGHLFHGARQISNASSERGLTIIITTENLGDPALSRNARGLAFTTRAELCPTTFILQRDFKGAPSPHQRVQGLGSSRFGPFNCLPC
jgi:hypothetical protein